MIARDEQPTADVEELVVLAQLVRDVAVAVASSRDNSVSVFFGMIAFELGAGRIGDRVHGHERQPMPIGGHHAHRARP